MVQFDTTIEGDAGADASLGRIDKYELVRELGEGGFGTVYLARDTVADVDVAVKGLPPEVKHNESELESIRGNFALVKRLRHPNIVAVTDLHQALSVSYASKDVESKLRVFERDTMVVMDYAPGMTLAQWRRQFPGGKVPLDKAIAVVRQIASALDYAHAQKVLHRDVKPANVMVETSDGGKLVARVLDFGLAAEIRSSMGRLSREIRDTSGTRPYMAPEQWKGERQGPATDQYALAAMFYELVVGDVPFASVFDCGDPAVMRIAVTTDAPSVPADLPKCVRRALAVALAKKPEERFASCGEFAAALEGKKVSRRGAETQMKSGAGKVIAALALIAAIGVGGLLYYHRLESRSADQTQQKPPSENGEATNVPAVKPRPAPTRKDVDAIYVEARVQMGACGRLDPSDGFKSRIEDCQKSFDFAGAQYDLGRWAEAALAFTNVVGECKTLIEQSNARDTAKSAAEILAEAIKVAQSAGAKEYAPVRFSSATDLAKRGRGEFEAFKFSDATATYASAKSQFDLAAKGAYQAKQEEARKKREAEEAAQRAEAERREREAREAAERERRAKWRQEGSALTGNGEEPRFTTYIVQRGDYLAKISKEFNVPISKIKLLNNLQEETLRVGQVIKLPGNIDVGVQDITGQRAIGDNPNGRQSYDPYAGPVKDYVVRTGDTLGGIAYSNGINIRQLKELNNMDQEVLRVGQILKVPAKIKR